MLRRNTLPIVIILVFLLIYGTLFAVLQGQGLYRITPETHNDRFFSMDDSYYVQHFYSTKVDDTGRVVKHPLLVAFAHYFTVAERAILGEKTLEHHYMLIILLQILVQVLGVACLYKILTMHYRLREWHAVLLTAIYGLSCASLLFTLIAESYVFSGALLIFTQWFILERKPVPVVIMGILLGGVTITNIFIWGLMVLLYEDKFLNRVIIGISGVFGLLLAIFLLPVRDVFYSQVFHVFYSSPANYRDSFPILTCARYGFYALFGSTWFFIDTVNTSPFGQFPGSAVSFIPSAPWYLTLIIGLWAMALLLGVILLKKDRLLLSPFLVLLFNGGLHVVIQYGLKEASLYSLHHAFAQILLMACWLREAGSVNETGVVQKSCLKPGIPIVPGSTEKLREQKTVSEKILILSGLLLYGIFMIGSNLKGILTLMR